MGFHGRFPAFRLGAHISPYGFLEVGIFGFPEVRISGILEFRNPGIKGAAHTLHYFYALHPTTEVCDYWAVHLITGH